MSKSKSPWKALSASKWLWPLAFGLLLLGLVGWGTLGNRNRVPHGIFIGDVGLGGLNWDEARSAVVDFLNQRKHHTVVLVGDAGICSVTLESLGASLDPKRTEASLRRLSEKNRGILGWLQKRTLLHPSLVLPESNLRAWLETCESRAIKERPVEGRLVPKDVDFVVQPSRAGRVVDRQRLHDVIGEAISRTDDAALTLPTIDRPELPTMTELERARLLAIELAEKPVVFRTEQSHLTLLRTDLAKLLEWHLEPAGTLTWRLARPLFDQWLGSRRHRVERRARDATYEAQGRERLVVVPEQKGSRIAVEQLFDDLERGLREGRRQLDIPFEPTELPKRLTADLDNLNIHEPVGTFTTRHACCQPRVNNIHRIADLLNGTIVMPGETYSVNEHVGQRSLDNGFVPAPSIEDGEMVDTIGGGVSQFATTFYNAVMRAGYDVLERQAHTYWFDRYPMGHEATLSWPKPDIVFRNDTKSGLLILASYTERSITIRLFGDREGRQVDVSVSPRFDIVRPSIEYLPNAELEPDKEHVKEGGCIGWSVWTLRTVRMKDGTSKQDKRKVVYKPRIRRVEVHPCKVPKGEPGHTGEKCPEPTAETSVAEPAAAE